MKGQLPYALSRMQGVDRSLLLTTIERVTINKPSMSPQQFLISHSASRTPAAKIIFAY